MKKIIYPLTMILVCASCANHRAAPRSATEETDDSVGAPSTEQNDPPSTGVEQRPTLNTPESGPQASGTESNGQGQLILSRPECVTPTDLPPNARFDGSVGAICRFPDRSPPLCQPILACQPGLDCYTGCGVPNCYGHCAVANDLPAIPSHPRASSATD